jgi:hypothetical protein
MRMRGTEFAYTGCPIPSLILWIEQMPEKKLTIHGQIPAGSGFLNRPGLATIFLLSPANISAKRGTLVLNQTAQFDLAQRLRSEGAPLGELFSFVSGLYFRGKLAYARVFANPPNGVPGVFAITSSRGLVVPETLLTTSDVREMARVPIEESDPKYREPLVRDARALVDQLGCRIVLLGSLASNKYTSPLLESFGARLLFPVEFVGRGDMSRGGLLLRCVKEGAELAYAPVSGIKLRGPRPRKLVGPT